MLLISATSCASALQPVVASRCVVASVLESGFTVGRTPKRSVRHEVPLAPGVAAMAGMAISVEASLRSGKISKGTKVASCEVLSTTDIHTAAARSAWMDTYGVNKLLRLNSDSILMMTTLCGATETDLPEV